MHSFALKCTVPLSLSWSHVADEVTRLQNRPTRRKGWLLRVVDLTVQRFNDSPHLDGIKLNQALSRLIKPSAAKFVTAQPFATPWRAFAVQVVQPIRSTQSDLKFFSKFSAAGSCPPSDLPNQSYPWSKKTHPNYRKLPQTGANWRNESKVARNELQANALPISNFTVLMFSDTLLRGANR